MRSGVKKYLDKILSYLLQTEKLINFKGGCMKLIGFIVGLLLVIGGLNWGLVGLFDFDLVAHLFGPGTVAARVIYGLVGLSAIIKILSCCPCACDKCAK